MATQGNKNKPNPNYEKYPLISDELIAALEKDYPERYPAATASDREIWIGRGRIDLIERLKAVRSYQRNE